MAISERMLKKNCAKYINLWPKLTYNCFVSKIWNEIVIYMFILSLFSYVIRFLRFFFLLIYIGFFRREGYRVAKLFSLYILRLVILSISVCSKQKGNSLLYFCEDLFFCMHRRKWSRSSSSFFITFFLPPLWCSSTVGIENQLPSLSHILIFMTFTLHEEIFS